MLFYDREQWLLRCSRDRAPFENLSLSAPPRYHFFARLSTFRDSIAILGNGGISNSETNRTHVECQQPCPVSLPKCCSMPKRDSGHLDDNTIRSGWN